MPIITTTLDDKILEQYWLYIEVLQQTYTSSVQNKYNTSAECNFPLITSPYKRTVWSIHMPYKPGKCLTQFLTFCAKRELRD